MVQQFVAEARRKGLSRLRPGGKVYAAMMRTRRAGTLDQSTGRGGKPGQTAKIL